MHTCRSERRHDLDWLRALAVLLLVPFHSALIFSFDPGDIVYVKDQVESQVLIQFAYSIHQWHMPLLFLIAGASTWFALEFRTAGEYLKERFTRLIVPTVFAITALIPPMIYVQFLGKPAFDSFWQFYFQFFEIDWNDLSGYSGTFTPAHLWFVIFLLVFSMVALPLFLYIKRRPGRRLIARLAAFFGRRGAIFFLGLLPAAVVLLPDIGGKPPFLYITFFIYGYILVADARFQKTMDRHALSALILAVIATLSIVYVVLNDVTFPEYSLADILTHLVYYFGQWCWVIAILGLGQKYLNVNNKILSYINEASYPFYILHLPINTIIAYFVIQWDTSVAVKYGVIIAATILATYAVYEVLVRRANVTRFLFGMKPLAKGRSSRFSAGYLAAQGAQHTGGADHCRRQRCFRDDADV